MLKAKLWKRVSTWIVLLGLSGAISASAATVSVTAAGLSPSSITIKSGDAVAWSQDDASGPYTLKGSFGTNAIPYATIFSTPGTYAYTVEPTAGGTVWNGTVHVNTNGLPTVAITGPTNGTTLIAPATFAFTATASDPDPNDLWEVQFYIGNTLLFTDSTPPFGTTVTNLAAGNYTLKAVAWDFSLARATNTVNITVINPGPIVLNSSAVSVGNFRFTATGLIPGRTNVVEASTNIGSALNWVAISTNVANGTSASYTNAVAPGSHFFRLIQWP